MAQTLLHSGFSFGGPIPQFADNGSLSTDEVWMKKALQTGLLGSGFSNPNPAVGCILVDANGQEVSRGHTQPYPGIHAELDAFSKVEDLRRLEGGTAYLTLEPCSHYGKQPPCSDLLAHSKISRIVIARKDPNPLVSGEGVERLEKSGKKVEVGVFAREATAWNFPFFGQLNFKRPVIILKWAQTLDGQLADDSQTSQWISSELARQYTHSLRQRYDAILVGARTVLKDLPRLDVRSPSGIESAAVHHPLPMVFDPNGLILKSSLETQASLAERTFRSGRSVVYLVKQSILRRFKNHWIERLPHVLILPLPGKNCISETVDIFQHTRLASILGHSLQSVLIEGGPHLIGEFLNHGYGDLLHTFIAPTLTGGIKHRISTKKLLKNAHRFQLMASFNLNSDVVMEMIASSSLQLFHN